MIYLVVLLGVLFRFGEGLVCLNCQDITHPRFCEHVEECALGESCGIEKRLDQFNEVTYDLGCRSAQLCSSQPVNTSKECITCCDSDLCNSKGCGETDANFDSKNVCYHCTGNLVNEECHKVAFCRPEELCFTKDEFRNTEMYIQSGCMDKTMCNNNGLPINSGFGKRANPHGCCSGNLCNSQIQLKTPVPPSELPTTLQTIPSPTTVKPTVVNVVPVHCSDSASTINSTVNCEFEQAICSYRQDINDKLDWTRHKGMTSSLNTGPSSDHTTSNGYYMYLETSLALRKGDNARLLSPPFSSSEGQCLTFWYNMYGVGVGTLNVYNTTSRNGQSNQMWSISGNHNNTWYQGTIPLSDSQSAIIVFEALAGDGYTGDIAIDDVKLMDACPCQHIPIPTSPPLTQTVLATQTATTMTVTSTPLPTTVETTMPTTDIPVNASTEATAIASPINCDFEVETICGYQQESNDTHEWMWHSGRTNSLNTGPNTDHTFNAPNGHYMYLETSNSLRAGEKARLSTPYFTPDPTQCLTFWYHMYGFTVGTLNVYTANNATGTEVLGNADFTVTGNQGQLWHRQCISFTGTEPISIVFEAVTGNGYTGDIAIDDVQVNLPCPCTSS